LPHLNPDWFYRVWYRNTQVVLEKWLLVVECRLSVVVVIVAVIAKMHFTDIFVCIMSSEGGIIYGSDHVVVAMVPPRPSVTVEH